MASVGGPSREGCSQCGGNLVKDYSGSMCMVLCEQCGTVATDEQLVLGGDNVETTEGLQNKTPHTYGELSKKIRTETSLFRLREKNFTKVIRQMASDVRLSDEDQKACIKEGTQILKTKIKAHKFKYLAAGLVFLSLRRHSALVTFKEVSERTRVSQGALGRMVKWLEKQPTSMSSGGTSRLMESFKLSTLQILERLHLPSDQIREVKQATVDLKRMIHGSIRQGARGIDGAILVVALSNKLTDRNEEEWTELVREIMCMKIISMRGRLNDVKGCLVDAASNLPSLAPQVKSKSINKTNITRHVHFLLENKSYLSSFAPSPSDETDSSDSDEGTVDPAEPVDPNEAHLPSLYHPASRHRVKNRFKRADVTTENGDKQESEEDNLADYDLDVEMYIASKGEVKEKKCYFKKHNIT